MLVRFEIGEKVTIKKPVSKQNLSARDSALHKYAGQIGTVTNYYWMRPPNSDDFCLYTVVIDTSSKDLVLYEDEIKRVKGRKLSRSSLKSQ